MKLLTTICAGSIMLSSSIFALQYDQDVTPDVIFGGGNANGAFTVDRNQGVELGLRGKLRHDSTGSPQNTFNSNGDGSYSFELGVAPTKSYPTAEWSFEWSINTNYDDSSGWLLNDLSYGLSMTSTTSSSFSEFDPINDPNYADHAIGDNNTGNGAGTVAADSTEYNQLISNNNVAQQSWKPHWIDTSSFDPTENGTYTFLLTASDSGGSQIAETEIDIKATPEPSAIALAVIGLPILGGIISFFRRKKRVAA